MASVVLAATGISVAAFRVGAPEKEAALTEQESCDIDMINLAVALGNAKGDPKALGEGYSNFTWWRFLINDYELWKTEAALYGADVAAAKSVARIQQFCRSLVGGG